MLKGFINHIVRFKHRNDRLTCALCLDIQEVLLNEDTFKVILSKLRFVCAIVESSIELTSNLPIQVVLFVLFDNDTDRKCAYDLLCTYFTTYVVDDIILINKNKVCKHKL